MLKIENTEVLGWGHAIRGMRNPMNSWDKSDSGHCQLDLLRDCNTCIHRGTDYPSCKSHFDVGPNDFDLMIRLRNAGTDHRKFMRMITVYLDITAPLYWWKEMDTYYVGKVQNSCSTMHKIAEKEFTLEDFSTEHLINDPFLAFSLYDTAGNYTGHDMSSKDIIQFLCNVMNYYRKKFLETKNKLYWWQIIQLLPTSYNQRRTVVLNYEVLANIYKSRRNHKLDEWHVLCDWIEGLPYSQIITGKEGKV